MKSKPQGMSVFIGVKFTQQQLASLSQDRVKAVLAGVAKIIKSSK